MNTTKAVINFANYADGKLAPVAQLIHDQMTLNAGMFTNPNPPIDMATLQTKIATYNTTLAAKGNRGKTDMMAFAAARSALEEALHELGMYVNLKAKGDPDIVAKSGFPSYDSARTPDPTPPAAPTNLRLKKGSLSGSIALQCVPDRTSSTNQAQYTTGDPNVESNWQDKGFFTGQKGEFSGFTPGTCVWIRVRTMGLKGIWGDWSDPAEIMVV